MTKVLFVYVTAPDADTAIALGSDAVERELAACANVLPGMTSIYRWHGAVERAQEAVLVLKTTEAAFAALKARLVERHPYDTPCIVAWPLTEGHSSFLDWVRDEVRAN